MNDIVLKHNSWSESGLLSLGWASTKYRDSRFVSWLKYRDTYRIVISGIVPPLSSRDVSRFCRPVRWRRAGRVAPPPAPSACAPGRPAGRSPASRARRSGASPPPAAGSSRRRPRSASPAPPPPASRSPPAPSAARPARRRRSRGPTPPRSSRPPLPPATSSAAPGQPDAAAMAWSDAYQQASTKHALGTHSQLTS